MHTPPPEKQQNIQKNKRRNVLLSILIPLGILIIAAAIIIPFFCCKNNKKDISTFDTSQVVKNIGSIEKGDNSDRILTNLFEERNPTLGEIDNWAGFKFIWSNKQFDDIPVHGIANLKIDAEDSSNFKGELNIGEISYDNNRWDLASETFENNIGNVSYNDHDEDDLTDGFKQMNETKNLRDVTFAWSEDEQWNAAEGERTLTLTALADSVAYTGSTSFKCMWEDEKIIPADFYEYADDHTVVGFVTGKDLTPYNTMIIPAKHPIDGTIITNIGIAYTDAAFFTDLPNNITTCDIGDNVTTIMGNDKTFVGCSFTHFIFGKSFNFLSAGGEYNYRFLVGFAGIGPYDKCPITSVTVRLPETPQDGSPILVDGEGNVQAAGTEMTIHNNGMLGTWQYLRTASHSIGEKGVRFTMGDVVVPANITTIGHLAFVSISGTYVTIDHLSFAGSDVTINGQDSTNWRAFSGCKILNIDFTNVNEIGYSAFLAVKGLTVIDLRNVTNLLAGLQFFNCPDVEEIYLGHVALTGTPNQDFALCSKVNKIVGDYSTTPVGWTNSPSTTKVMQDVGMNATEPKIVESTNTYEARDLLDLLTDHLLSGGWNFI